MREEAVTLRTDERSWLIYDDESIGAVVRMLEAYALSVTGQKMMRHPEIEIRAVGNMMLRLGETRGAECLQEGGAKGVAAQHMALLGAHLAGIVHNEIQCRKALTELHAVVFRLDQKARTTGTKGPGSFRRALRGD